MHPMKIVVFGPDKRTGALHDGNVVDLSYTCVKYLREREGEPGPLQMAEALVPSDLARLIEGGPRALEHATAADSSELLPDGSSAPERFSQTRRSRRDELPGDRLAAHARRR